MGMDNTILWLTGWSMPDEVFDSLRNQLPQFQHVSAVYSSVNSPEEIIEAARSAALRARGSEDPDRTGSLLVIGWSLGGLLALRLAIEGLVDGAVLMSATACFTRHKDEMDRGWPVAFVRQMISAIQVDRPAVLKKFRESMFSEMEREAGIANNFPICSDWTTQALIAGLRLLCSEDLRPQLPQIGCPVLILHGSDDKLCPQGAADEIHEQVRQSELYKTVGAGHAPFWEKERQIADRIGGWWDERQTEQHSAAIQPQRERL